jgi:carboxylesterase type B
MHDRRELGRRKGPHRQHVRLRRGRQTVARDVRRQPGARTYVCRKSHYRRCVLPTKPQPELRVVQKFQSDTFAYGAYSMAEAMARSAKKYPRLPNLESGAHLGAYHGEELCFLSDSYAPGWKHDADDQRLSELMRRYWAQFARTGDPNLSGAAPWAPFNEQAKEYFELGRNIGGHQVSAQLLALEHILRQAQLETNGPRSSFSYLGHLRYAVI